MRLLFVILLCFGLMPIGLPLLSSSEFQTVQNDPRRCGYPAQIISPSGLFGEAASFSPGFGPDSFAYNFRSMHDVFLLSVVVLRIAGTMISSSVNTALAWYIAQLETYPVAVKSITSGAMALAGDCLAQTLENTVFRTDGSEKQSYSPHRALSMMAGGLLITGPALHVGYGWLEQLVPVDESSSLSSSAAAVIHVAVDTFVFDPFFIATTLMLARLREGSGFSSWKTSFPSVESIQQQVRADYLPTVLTSWVASAVLFPAQFTFFWCLPVSLRVLAVNCLDIVWDTVLSYMAHRNHRI